ncbi:MFS transporter [Hornefia butyriciproducens]|uniref:MFS transporter n=2 Tax=Hornefia butyriciproducens TaxID=2652293 RepID=A0A6L5Y5J5_9FIRM|nr:MFS transporter [Hornefia butyriciproducens]MCI7327838.1 MFS transporter [Clostridiales bacterium]MST51745.1 MFS transporter [Hornefia butyriciproducens]
MSSTNKGAGGKAWAIVIFFTLFMVTMTFNLIVYPACAADTMRQYGISQAGLTTLSSVTSVVGLFAGFIFGPILDKRGSRKTILFGLLVGAVLFFVRVLVTSYALAIVLTFLASFFVGVCQVAASKVLATWFTPQTVSVAYSFQAAGAGFGSAGAFIIGAALGLKGSLLLIAIAYTVLFIYWLIAGKDGPIAVQGAQPPKGSSAMVWKSRTLWLMAIAASCAVGSTLLINSYCINAFVGKGMNPGQAALIGTVLNLSLLVGGYLGTFLMSVIKRYNIVTLICFIGGAVGYLMSWFSPLGAATWCWLVIGGLLMGGTVGLTMGRTALIPLTGQFPVEAIGSAGGALEAIKGAITFVFPIVIANIFATNYNAIFITFGVLCVIGFVTGGLLVPELGPKGKLQQEQAQNSH